MTRNMLGSETSPYLLQHKDNPVHWMPWGPEALSRARRTNRPILLSVGYAACHWCHVMAHECFENEAIAAQMNEHYVNIKVDREERPDIDKIYMEALHRLGEQGGWPLTMFLTPDGEPFWGGTYFPPEDRYGRPGFPTVLREIARIYHQEPEKVRHNAGALMAALNAHSPTAPHRLSLAALDLVTSQYLNIIDHDNGGLKGAPKFPQVPIFEAVWRGHIRSGEPRYRQAVEVYLQNICQGGIYDHLGGGFSRYSVDHRWLVPHFEKMLYDNAVLLQFMTLVWQRTRRELLRIRIEETVDWVLREMVTDSGAFASSIDADSEGEEGRFYVWSEEEIRNVLGADVVDLFCEVYGVTPGGNFEGHTILNRLDHLDLMDEDSERLLKDARLRLFGHRENRTRPGWDDKVLADWNGLMIAALAFAGSVFNRAEWIAAAARAFHVIHEKMVIDGKLHHSMRAGRVQHLAIADDYANLIRGALALFEATGDASYVTVAEKLVEQMDRDYWDEAEGGYFYTSSAADSLIARQKTALDDATPNANATMIGNLARLALFTGLEAYQKRAEAIVSHFGSSAEGNIYSSAGFFNGFEDLLALSQVIIIAPDRTAAADLLRAVNEQSIPTRAVMVIDEASQLPPGHPAQRKTKIEGLPTLYLCHGNLCSAPITNTADLPALLQQSKV